ncbi:MAG: hypothetical protein ACOX8W_08475 [bacterium]
MFVLKDKNYFPYALANYFTNNERWQARTLSSPQYQELAQRVEQYKEENRTKAEVILNSMDETLALLEGINIDEAATEGLRAGLDLGELLYSGKSLETLLHENAFTTVKEREAC